MQSHSVYIMASESGVLYIGVTNDLHRRVSEHKLKIIEGFTKQYNCTKLIFYEDFSDIKQVIAREKYLKGKKRIFKEELIKTVNVYWKDLSKEWAE